MTLSHHQFLLSTHATNQQQTNLASSHPFHPYHPSQAAVLLQPPVLVQQPVLFFQNVCQIMPLLCGNPPSPSGFSPW